MLEMYRRPEDGARMVLEGEGMLSHATLIARTPRRGSRWAVGTALLGMLAGLALALDHPFSTRPAAGSASAAVAGRTVYVVGHLPDEDLIALTAGAAGGDPPGVVLIDSPKARPYFKSFIRQYRPDRIVLAGLF